jgi:hypothetical protein
MAPVSLPTYPSVVIAALMRNAARDRSGLTIRVHPSNIGNIIEIRQ